MFLLATLAGVSRRKKTQPVVKKQQAARMTSDRIEQLTQTLLAASPVKSSEPIKNSQLPTVV